MSQGIFCVESDKGLTVSNGSFITYGGNSYLVTCAHSFYDKCINKIHFIVEPELKNKNVLGKCHLEDLPLPFFHPADNETETYEVGIIKLENKEIVKFMECGVVSSQLVATFPILNPTDRVLISGYDSFLLNSDDFQGKIQFKTSNFQFVLKTINLLGPHPLSSRAPLDCYVLAKNNAYELGSGFSGSVVHLINDDNILGIYHTSAAPLKNGFDLLTPNGCAVFTSFEKIIEAITRKV